MNSYFDVMVQLMMMTGIITLVMMPLMWQLSSFEALSNYPTFSDAKYTLGNIGGAQSICAAASFMHEGTSLRLECPPGTLLDFAAVSSYPAGKLFDVGLIPADSKINTYCATTDDAV